MKTVALATGEQPPPRHLDDTTFDLYLIVNQILFPRRWANSDLKGIQRVITLSILIMCFHQFPKWLKSLRVPCCGDALKTINNPMIASWRCSVWDSNCHVEAKFIHQINLSN